jgi:cytochrome c6
MFRRMAGIFLLLTVSVGMMTGCSRDDAQAPTVTTAGSAATVLDTAQDGEALFKQYCAACHPNGGNVSDPGKSLYASSLKRNHITTPEDVVRIMRNPRSRMIRLDAATLPERDAQTIAEYVLKTFK